jgi:hypothetical protein
MAEPKPTCLFVFLVAMTLAGFAGCSSPGRELAAAKDQCAAQGFAPSTSAFEDCIADANSRRHDAEARQSARMQQLQDMSTQSFLHSQSAAP